MTEPRSRKPPLAPRPLQWVVRPVLGTEHFLQHRQDSDLGLIIDPAEFSEEPGLVHRPDLIQHDLALLALKLIGDPRRIFPPARRHRGNDHRLDMAIHFIGRDDQARAAFLDLAADGGIETDQEHIEAPDYHCHSVVSQSVGALTSSSRSRSSACSAMARKASSRPCRGRSAGRITVCASWTSSSTSSPSPLCSMRTLGMRIPCELPMAIMRVFMGP